MSYKYIDEVVLNKWPPFEIYYRYCDAYKQCIVDAGYIAILSILNITTSITLATAFVVLQIAYGNFVILKKSYCISVFFASLSIFIITFVSPNFSFERNTLFSNRSATNEIFLFVPMAINYTFLFANYLCYFINRYSSRD